MADNENLGHEPDETHDREFAPVNRGSDARGRSVPGEDTGAAENVAPAEEGMARQEDEVSGTGVPGVDVGQPDALPAGEEGVRAAERGDATREHPE